MRDHWQAFGRNYYTRHDYEGIDAEAAGKLVADLRARLPSLAGQKLGQETVARADDFSYHDPVDGSTSERQGLRLLFESGARIVYRLSGTGTEGATLRVYIERYEEKRLAEDTQAFLAPLIRIAGEVAGIAARTGRQGPDVVT